MDRIIDSSLYFALDTLKENCDSHQYCKGCPFVIYKNIGSGKITNCMLTKKIPTYYNIGEHYFVNVEGKIYDEEKENN